jgi:hypothetical protein
MTRSPADAAGNSPLATRGDIKDILGERDDGTVMAIMSFEPTVEDLEEAAMWLAGDRDVFGAGRPLQRIAGEIVTILTAGEEEESSRSG